MFGITKKIFPLVLIGGLVAIATVVALGYGSRTVSQGETLWSITGELGVSPTRWPEIFEANPGLKKFERNGKTVVLIRPGQEILIPDTLVPAPAPIEPEPATIPLSQPTGTPVVPGFKSAIEPDWFLIALLLAVLFATLLGWYWDEMKRAAGRARQTAERGLREMTNIFFPTALQPCYAGGVGAWDVAAATGWDPNGLQLKPAYGEYDVNCRLADGSVRSERRVLNGQLSYSPRGSNGSNVVLKDCGNVASRVAGTRRQTLPKRLERAVRLTFRPEPTREPVVVAPARPKPAVVIPIRYNGEGNGKVVVHNSHRWNVSPQVLKQDPKKGGVFLEPVWRVPDPA